MVGRFCIKGLYCWIIGVICCVMFSIFWMLLSMFDRDVGFVRFWIFCNFCSLVFVFLLVVVGVDVAVFFFELGKKWESIFFKFFLFVFVFFRFVFVICCWGNNCWFCCISCWFGNDGLFFIIICGFINGWFCCVIFFIGCCGNIFVFFFCFFVIIICIGGGICFFILKIGFF